MFWTRETPQPLEDGWEIVENADDAIDVAALNRVKSSECIHDAVVVESADAPTDADAVGDTAARDVEAAQLRARADALHAEAYRIIDEARAAFALKLAVPHARDAFLFERDERERVEAIPEFLEIKAPPPHILYRGAFVFEPDAHFERERTLDVCTAIAIQNEIASFMADVRTLRSLVNGPRLLRAKHEIDAEKRARHEHECLERRNYKWHTRNAWKRASACWFIQFPNGMPLPHHGARRGAPQVRAREKPARAVAPRSDRPHYARRAK